MTGVPPSRGVKRTLSRFVTRISRPSTIQVPSFSSASRAADRSLVGWSAIGREVWARSASAVARAVGTARSRRTVARVLLGLDPLVGRLAQQIVGGPLRELDADDEPRLDPARAAQAWRGIERRVRPLDLLQLREELATGSRAESAADLAGVNPAVPRADGEDQRAEVGVRSPGPAASRRRRPPARGGPSA